MKMRRVISGAAQLAGVFGLLLSTSMVRAEVFLDAKIMGMHRDIESTQLLLKVVNTEYQDTELFPPAGTCNRNAIYDIHGFNGDCWGLSLREGNYLIKEAKLQVVASYLNASYLWVRYATPKAGVNYPLIAVGIGINGFHNGAGENELQATSRSRPLISTDPWVAVHEEVDVALNIAYQDLLYALSDSDNQAKQRQDVIAAQRQWLKTVIYLCGAKPRSSDDEEYARCRLPLVGQRWEELARTLTSILGSR